MPYCTSCGKPVEAASNFCIDCGKPISGPTFALLAQNPDIYTYFRSQGSFRWSIFPNDNTQFESDWQSLSAAQRVDPNLLLTEYAVLLMSDHVAQPLTFVSLSSSLTSLPTRDGWSSETLLYRVDCAPLGQRPLCRKTAKCWGHSACTTAKFGNRDRAKFS
jgi:hypothetical protein